MKHRQGLFPTILLHFLHPRRSDVRERPSLEVRCARAAIPGGQTQEVEQRREQLPSRACNALQAPSPHILPGHQEWNLSCCKRKTLAIFPVSECVISVHARLQRVWARAFPPEIATAISVSPGTRPDPLQTHLIRNPGEISGLGLILPLRFLLSR